jgi:peptidoglycan hydrolase-like protein with peptidoglycan-binding domain
MKIKYIVSSLFVSALFLAPLGVAQAQTATVKSLLEQLQALQKQVQELQSQISQTKKQIRTLRADLREGVRHEDVRDVQEILSTDESIYPEGLVTGYYGPLTKAALRRLQQRFDLKVTGEVDEETRRYLEALLQEKFGDRVPPGLLRAPGIQKKTELRIRDKCNSSVLSAVQGQFCQKIKVKVEKDKDSEGSSGSSKVKVKVESSSGSNNTGTGSGGDVASCPADTNFDGEVDGDDLDSVNKLWGTDGQKGTVDADVNGDGVVAFDDLLLVLSGWGTCDDNDGSLGDDIDADSLDDEDDDNSTDDEDDN